MMPAFGPWLANQLDASVVAAVLFAIAWLGRRRLSVTTRSTLLIMGLVRLALPPAIAAPWTTVGDLVLPAGPAATADVAPTDLSLALFVFIRLVPAVLVARFLFASTRETRRLRATTGAAPPAVAARLGALAGADGHGRAPALRVSDDVGGCAVGLWQPTIVLPRAFLELDEPALDAVLAHELAHHRRQDLLWLYAGRVLCLLAWFNPLAHVLSRALVSAREDGSDDWAVARTSGRADTYCDALLRAARASAARVPMASLGAHPMAARLGRLLSVQTACHDRVSRRQAACLLVAAAAALPGPATPAGAQSPARDPDDVVIEIVIRDNRVVRDVGIVKR